MAALSGTAARLAVTWAMIAVEGCAWRPLPLDSVTSAVDLGVHDLAPVAHGPGDVGDLEEPQREGSDLASPLFDDLAPVVPLDFADGVDGSSDTDPFFRAIPPLPAGNQTYSVAAADLNRDERIDLVVGNSVDPGAILVFLGHGDGTFDEPVHYAAGVGADNLRLADFDGDGNTDVVAASDGKDCQIMLGRADGSFGSAVAFPCGPEPYGIAVADFDSDGRPDLAVANYVVPGTVSLLLGRGDGTFGAPIEFAAGNGPLVLVSADVDGDQHADAMAANYNSTTASVMLGNGHGALGPPLTFACGQSPGAIAVGDVDGDGKPDLIVGNSVGDVSTLLGHGDGSFVVDATFHNKGGFVNALALADVDGNDTLDLLVADIGLNEVHLLLGNGDGSFQAVRDYPVPAPASGLDPADVIATDLNRDGRPDAVVANGGGSVTVLLNVH